MTTGATRRATLQGLAGVDGPPPTTAQRIAGRLRAAILAGEISHGSSLSESEVASTLRVSRNTAREALRQLTSEGLLVHDPHHSPRVRLLSAEDAADVFAVRCALELAAVDLIERLPSRPDFAELERAVARLASLVGAGDAYEVLEADREFHVGLIASAASPRLSAIYDRLESEIRLCLSISTRSHRDVQELVDQHDHFLRLLREGSYDAFRSDLARHMDLAATRVTTAISVGRETPSRDGG